MRNVRGPLLRSLSEPSDGEPLRIPVSGSDASHDAAPNATAERNARSEVQPPCELPAPTDAGRIYNPPHPMFAIAFVYFVSLALLWGALSSGNDPIARLAVTFLGLGVCLVAAVHWIEGVELAHAPAKLGVCRAPARAWWVAIAAAAASLAWAGRALLAHAAAPADAAAFQDMWSAVLRTITLLAAAAWYEGFYRGFVFRSLMRRHGFVTSAAVSALLLSAATVVAAGSPFLQGRAVAVAAVEIALSCALCALFWVNRQSLGPVFVVRVAVLAATWWTASVWPALAATALILFFVRLQRSRSSTTSP